MLRVTPRRTKPTSLERTKVGSGVIVRTSFSGGSRVNTLRRLKSVGKKTRAWIKDRARLITESVTSGRIIIADGAIQGRCAICKRWMGLDPDHIVKRSQGGGNEGNNIQWICRTCHERGDNMADSPKQTNKKPGWMKKHQCKVCKKQTGLFLCEWCGKVSI